MSSETSRRRSETNRKRSDTIDEQVSLHSGVAMIKSEFKGTRGFTLIELVIVVVLLGLLAAVAIPRFIDVTERAEDATVEGVAGGFATAVGLVRAEWELEARPEGNSGTNLTSVTLDGITVGVDQDTGYPTGQINNDGSTEDTTISDIDCASVFNLILQSSPTITSNFTDIQTDNFRYFTTVSTGNGSENNDICLYYLAQTILNVTTEPNSDTTGNGFIYDPRIGQVIVFSNNTQVSTN